MSKFVELLDCGVKIATRFHSHCPQTGRKFTTLRPAPTTTATTTHSSTSATTLPTVLPVAAVICQPRCGIAVPRLFWALKLQNSLFITVDLTEKKHKLSNIL
ncbi:hypothetical protein CJ030_MR0G007843 [Morella rubra]|uniref:Uncharacterized protein n=1 Tax=Morella rubra TaxID=262757 RepID=A0A6A1UJ25_9ROSI|nr:hypothetical protein CJ030_MR0G007843 [Morella rubra]